MSLDRLSVSAGGQSLGYSVNVERAGQFEEAYAGEWGSIEEYAENLADDIGAIDGDAKWPMMYIDWERAARDLVLGGDVWTADSIGGVYVFNGNV